MALAIALAWYLTHPKTFFRGKKSSKKNYDYLGFVLAHLKNKSMTSSIAVRHAQMWAYRYIDYERFNFARGQVSLQTKYWLNQPQLFFEGLAETHDWAGLAWYSGSDRWENLIQQLPDWTLEEIRVVAANLRRQLGLPPTIFWSTGSVIDWILDEQNRRLDQEAGLERDAI